MSNDCSNNNDSEIFSISSHILDTTRGCPASNMKLELEVLDGEGNWVSVYTGITNDDGRVSDLPKDLVAGNYCMTFFTTEYFEQNNIQDYFYPYVKIFFKTKPNQHFHIPLLISPFGYTTYRGS
eukprot:TRINITY_DN136637_c0_g1_i1.p1 TRINITY_DN136637_c0_g1~~TRINITY_DN136637_c0_g1_i1.p1  ORF type:complete len:124 (-),score=14.81 TRINITY_DN136637_c0_g1_i1:39-410(-)